ncbi:MAG: ATP-binding protein [Holophaga sp.]|jgi:signal transduction histidine kinase
MDKPQDASRLGFGSLNLREVFRPRSEMPPEVMRKLIRITHDLTPMGLLVNVVLTVVLAWTFMVPGTAQYELIWILATVILNFLRYVDCVAHGDLTLEPRRLSRARADLRIGSALQGLLWGVATFLLPASPLQQMFLMTVTCGVIAAALVIHFPLWSTYALFSVPAIIPLCVRLVGGGMPTLQLIGLLGLVYCFTMLYIAARANRWLEVSLLAAQENESLTIHLRSANEALVEYHARLEAAVEARTQELRAANARLQEEFAAKEAERARNEEREEALRRAQKLESLGLLAGGIAHDFNNLLGAILGNLNLLQLQTPAETPGRTCLDNMEKAVNQASNLTRQLLAYSGKGHFTIRNLDLNQVVQDLTSLLDVCISKRSTLRLDLGRDLPPIYGDQAQLQQVVMNLVTNASEALGGEEGEIRIATRSEALDEASAARVSRVVPTDPGPHVVLEVADTGRGMEPEVLARIFDPFFTTKEHGRGLGLSAMLGILKGHGAGIEIASRPRAGSTFRLYFPVSARTGEAPEAEAPKEAGTFRGRVLVVDDEPVLLETTRAMMERLGLRVAAAADGLQAMEFMASHGADVDLVLLDLTMPLMDGRQTFRALRRLRPGLPIIFSSGNDPRRFPRGSLPFDGRLFLRKPYTMEDLRSAVAAALGLDRSAAKVEV